MAKVIIYGRENFEKALKHFKRRCLQEGIFRECRDRRHYIKPSKKKRDKRKNHS
ncbi:MAG: 30S ribosomal protein S21 [Omnitrophica bacterium RBG_13_46_9]|nr:MAG: 30S ribosomal protein S21 [Omnitrophica bacterium RBG_13_46_9]